MPTLADLQRLHTEESAHNASLRRDIALAQKLLGQSDRRLAELAEAIAEMAEVESRLTGTQQDRSMFRSKMDIQVATARKNVKTSAKMSSDSEAKKALIEAEITPRDVAKLLGVGHSTVNAWCTGARSIPKRYAARLASSKHKIPVGVWPKLAD